MGADPARRGRSPRRRRSPPSAPIRPRGPITTFSPITASGPTSVRRVDPGGGGDNGRRMDAGRDRRQRMEQRRDLRPGDQRVGRRRSRPRFPAPALHVRVNDHRRGLGCRQRRQMLAVVQAEADVAVGRRLQRGDAVQHQPARRRLRPPAASTTAARLCGPARRKKRGSPANAERSTPGAMDQCFCGGLAAAVAGAGCGGGRRRWLRRRASSGRRGHRERRDAVGRHDHAGQRLVQHVGHRRGQVEIRRRAQDLRSVEHKVDAAGQARPAAPPAPSCG